MWQVPSPLEMWSLVTVLQGGRCPSPPRLWKPGASCLLGQSPWAAVTKDHSMGSSKNTDIDFLTVLGALGPGSRRWQDWFLQGSLSLVHTQPPPPCTLHGLRSVWVCVLISSYKAPSQEGLWLTLVSSFYPNHLFRCPVSRQSHILRYWGFGCQDRNLVVVGDTTQFITPMCCH